MLARRGGLFRGAVVKVRVPQMRFWLTLIALGEAISSQRGARTTATGRHVKYMTHSYLFASAHMKRFTTTDTMRSSCTKKWNHGDTMHEL
jgi:hypothetical protein